MKRNIVIFASGEGTNAQCIIDHFNFSSSINVAMVASNKAEANVLNRAKKAGIQTLVIDRKSFYETEEVVDVLKKNKTDLIVLAGFLWMIPENLVTAFPNAIVNIHPSLLPKFGGKGMYGMNVHRAVIEAKEKESGITIHFVNGEYDKGKIISQHRCDVSENESAESLAGKIQNLEHLFFPKAIEKILS